MRKFLATLLFSFFFILDGYSYSWDKLEDPKDKSYLFSENSSILQNGKTVSASKGRGQKFEIGIRFWDDIGIDFCLNLAKNRVHFTGTFGNRFNLSVYYDWIFNIENTNGLALYVGAGGKISFGDPTDFGIGANLGIQYAFDIPLSIGFDWRPTWWLTHGSNFSSGDYAFMARFRF
ncbi:hypothetical protein [Flammeovirga sp. SubArs3]|uniref:hypothetical protein n=1 Tax=Flammeovirga sp. SubArs3 TaxID=2995316 RepID=UPI00248C23C8|nr:hypothetical protein [Flammeovirga sp. SubArs3]